MDINSQTVWVVAAIEALKGKYNGAHTAITGLSGAFVAKFGCPLYRAERDSAGKFVALSGPLAAMIDAGAIVARPVKGGLMLYEASGYKAAQVQRQERERGAVAAKNADLAARIDATIAAGKAKR
jgi:hypothetical protein